MKCVRRDRSCFCYSLEYGAVIIGIIFMMSSGNFVCGVFNKGEQNWLHKFMHCHERTKEIFFDETSGKVLKNQENHGW